MIMFQQFSNGMKCNFESAKSKKMGDIMFCSAWRLWFYVVSWSIWPNDHHMSTNLDFSMFPSQTELLSTKKRPKIYVTGLKISKNDMIFMTMDVCCWPGCFGPSCLLAPCWSCKPATIWQRTSEGLTGRSGVGKKKNKHSWNTGTLHFRRRNTHPLQENNIRIQLESSGHL